MKKKVLLCLLGALLALSLAACGGKDSGSSDDQQKDQQDTAVQPEKSENQPEENQPENTQPEDGQPEEDQTSEPDSDDKGTGGGASEEAVTASHKDVTLKNAGDSFRLLPVGVEGAYACTYTVKDPAIVTVDDADGTVTAASPGSTTVSMHVEGGSGQYDFDCIVRCTWTDSEEPAQPDTSTEPASTPSLSGFFDTLAASYEGLDTLAPLEGEVLEAYYPGLSALPVKEMLVQETQMSMQNCAVALVTLSDDAGTQDVIAVQEIFSARIKTQAEGGAWYPASCEVWENGVITSTSKTVGMFVYDGAAQEMANAFADAFKN